VIVAQMPQHFLQPALYLALYLLLLNRGLPLKNASIAVAALGALFAGSAMAADMPVKAPVKAPPPVFDWTGFYIGGNVGYGWGHDDTDINPGPTPAVFVNLLPQNLATRPQGGFAGGQAGYNWQTGSVVIGAQVDFQGASITGTVVESPIIQNNGTPFPGTAPNLTITQKLDWFGTAQARFGVAVVPQFLLYATGGFAYGRVSGTANTDFRPTGTEQYPASASSNRTGWAAGVGGEWLLGNNWTVKAEYLHLNLGGTDTVVAQPVLPLPPFTVTYNFNRMRIDVARAGLNYKFGGPVVANY
jgi:outer membrane immunogenic protein